ncbi:unannotated protein [freshwater metagenome]|uniref:Unannotated protein n=1 Tax=freshwater metagenome TaxID=449393 RepID=A0A6J7JEX8_9ZZZZ
MGDLGLEDVGGVCSAVRLAPAASGAPGHNLGLVAGQRRAAVVGHGLVCVVQCLAQPIGQDALGHLLDPSGTGVGGGDASGQNGDGAGD